MKTISLTKGMFALVDNEDYDYLNQWKWYTNKCINTNYAIRDARNTDRTKGKQILMHRLILNISDNMFCDHIDHNGLNNQKTNLRIVDKIQNAQNSNKRKNTSTKYKGVCTYNMDYNYKSTVTGVTKRYEYPLIYSSQIRVNKKTIHLGYFKNEIEAAIAYNKAAILYFKEYALLNILPIKEEV